MTMQIINSLESNVRGYCRAFPTTFSRATGATLTDARGRSYIDFFAGAGSLNYGHNPEPLKSALVDYITADGITHALDLATEAKEAFLESLQRLILKPRGLDHKVMFPGPTGTNSVEAALKIARKVTGRSEVIAFTNAFHGMTLGSLALTGNTAKRNGGGVALGNVTRHPFEGYMGADFDTANYLDTLLSDTSSGVPLPAAVILETVQAEGGVNTASAKWLRSIERVTHKHGALLIIDDIQAGCGRTGKFFSFEDAGIKPDIICLSKSLSGYGLPFALTLMKREFDALSPGEHNGTFRGNNLAFVTARAALETFWRDTTLSFEVERKAGLVRGRLEQLQSLCDGELRGRGFLQGIAFNDTRFASRISAAAFERGLMIETSGRNDEVLKFLAPLTISEQELQRGLDLLEETVVHLRNSDVKQNKKAPSFSASASASAPASISLPS